MNLLDVNILLALADSEHSHHSCAKAFFTGVRSTGWATCPIVENGFSRILSGRSYARPVASPQIARLILERIMRFPGHQFWPDDLSLCDHACFPNLPHSKHLTDCYLLALAVKRGGKLVTFDRGINSTWMPGGDQALLVLETESP